MTTNKHTLHEHEKTLLSWEAPEFMPTPRGKLWYLTACLVFGLLIFYGFISGNITMALVFIMAAVAYAIIEKRPPREVQINVTDLGVWINHRFFPYHHINAFWIIYHPPYVRSLYLRIKEGRRLHSIRIELFHEKPQEVRQALLREVPEIEGAQEPIIDVLNRILRLQ